MVIRGPIAPGGVRQGLFDGDRRQALGDPTPERAARCRQDQPPHRGRVLAQPGTGPAPSARSRPGSAPRHPAARAASTTGPPATRLSLLASASRLPASRAATEAGRPAAPTIPLTTVVPGQRRQIGQRLRRRTRPGRPARRRNAPARRRWEPRRPPRASGWARGQRQQLVGAPPGRRCARTWSPQARRHFERSGARWIRSPRGRREVSGQVSQRLE